MSKKGEARAVRSQDRPGSTWDWKRGPGGAGLQQAGRQERPRGEGGRGEARGSRSAHCGGSFHRQEPRGPLGKIPLDTAGQWTEGGSETGVGPPEGTSRVAGVQPEDGQQPQGGDRDGRWEEDQPGPPRRPPCLSR